MHPFCILMLIFAGAILLYAGLLALTKDYGLIMRGYSTQPKDKKAYTMAFAKMMAVVAMSPLSAAFYGYFNVALGIIALSVSMVVCIWLGTQFFRDL